MRHSLSFVILLAATALLLPAHDTRAQAAGASTEAAIGAAVDAGLPCALRTLPMQTKRAAVLIYRLTSGR